MSFPFRPRWPLLLTLAAGVAALIALAYVPARTATEELPAPGGSYVEGVAGAPSRMNPLFATFNEVDQDLVSLIFSGLVRLGPRGNVQPDLAEWTVSPDGLTYIFQLRPDLLWHDNVPLDAGDVLFTVQAIQDPEFRGDPVLADLYRDVEVTASDARTIVMTLPQPFAPFLARGATVGILPDHLLRNLTADEIFQSSFNQSPVGSGPFELLELTPEGAVLRAFGPYHLGRPLLETLELRFFRDDGALFNALRQDEVEGALFRPGLDPEKLALLEGDTRWVRRTLHTTTYSLVYVNPQSAAFQDAAVRRALQNGLDRTRLIEEVLAGQALLIDSPIIRDLWSYAGDSEAYAFARDRANALLDEAGWLLAGGLRAKDGEVLRFTLATSDDPIQSRVAAAIAAQWRELGIDVEVQTSGAGLFVEQVLLPRDFEAALISIEPGPDPDPYPFWHSSQAIGEGRNLASFVNREADRLLENGRLANSDGERAASYGAFQEIFARELPAVLLYTPTYQYVVRADVGDVKPGLLFTLSARFQNVHDWFVETEPLSAEEE